MSTLSADHALDRDIRRHGDALHADDDARDQATDELCGLGEDAYHDVWCAHAEIEDWVEIVNAGADQDMARIDAVRERVESRWIEQRVRELLAQERDDAEPPIDDGKYE